MTWQHSLKGMCRPMRKTRTALQADDRLLHESSFSLSFCLTVLASQPVRLTALERRYLVHRSRIHVERASFQNQASAKLKWCNAAPGFLRLPQQVAPIDDESPSHSPDLTHLLELA